MASTGSSKKHTNKAILKHFEWTPTRRKAAHLIAFGQEPKTVIAKQLGIHRKTISFWETFPEFQREVQERREKYIIATDKQVTKALSEQLLAMRTVLSKKLSNAKELEKIPTEKLLAEFRKYLAEVFKVSKGGDVMVHQHEGNFTYGGKLQIEQLLGSMGPDDQQRMAQAIDGIADQILEERAREIEESGPKFPGDGK